MTTDTSNHFRNFAASLLEYEGALVEALEPAGLEAMLPEPLQQQLHAPEFLRLGFAAELPADAERASLESNWLERFAQLLGGRGQRLVFVTPADLPPPASLERAIERAVELQNAVYRLANIEPAWTRYLLCVFRYAAVSDEKREALVKLGFNLANGSTPDPFVETLLAAALSTETNEAALKPAAEQLPPDWPAARLQRAVTVALPQRVRAQLNPFVNGMQRRLERDLARVHEYYTGLRAEAWRKLHKPKGDAAREQLRLDAAAREYQAKVADLKQKYALTVKVELIQTLELHCPVQRATLLIKRRKGERKLPLDWNPLARQFEPLPCEWSFVADGPRVVCDDALHLVSSAGHAGCVQCGKEFCRACARRCPKCGKEAG